MFVKEVYTDGIHSFLNNDQRGTCKERRERRGGRRGETCEGSVRGLTGRHTFPTSHD